MARQLTGQTTRSNRTPQSLNSESHASSSYQQADRDGQVEVMQEQDAARQEDLARHEERDSKRQIAYRDDFEDEEAPGADESPETQRAYQNQDYQRTLSDSEDTDDMEAEEREAVYPGYPGGSDTSPYSPEEGSFPSSELLSWSPSHDLNESENFTQAGDFPLRAVINLTISLHRLHTLPSDDGETQIWNDDPRPLPPSSETTRYFLTPIYNPIDPTCTICLGPYGLAHEPCKLLCGHVFGEKCIERWFDDHSTCPLCRFDYREELCDGDYENDGDFEHVGYISEGE